MGERPIISVLDETGNLLRLNDEQGVSEYETIRAGSEYKFVSSSGDTFIVDFTSSQSRYLFSLDVPWSEYLSVFQVIETGVYMLKNHRVDRVVALSYRPWEGGGWRDVFTTHDPACYLKKGVLMWALDIQSSALEPDWGDGVWQGPLSCPNVRDAIVGGNLPTKVTPHLLQNDTYLVEHEDELLAARRLLALVPGWTDVPSNHLGTQNDGPLKRVARGDEAVAGLPAYAHLASP